MVDCLFLLESIPQIELYVSVMSSEALTDNGRPILISHLISDPSIQYTALGATRNQPQPKILNWKASFMHLQWSPSTIISGWNACRSIEQDRLWACSSLKASEAHSVVLGFFPEILTWSWNVRSKSRLGEFPLCGYRYSESFQPYL